MNGRRRRHLERIAMSSREGGSGCRFGAIWSAEEMWLLSTDGSPTRILRAAGCRSDRVRDGVFLGEMLWAPAYDHMADCGTWVRPKGPLGRGPMRCGLPDRVVHVGWRPRLQRDECGERHPAVSVSGAGVGTRLGQERLPVPRFERRHRCLLPFRRGDRPSCMLGQKGHSLARVGAQGLRHCLGGPDRESDPG